MQLNYWSFYSRMFFAYFLTNFHVYNILTEIQLAYVFDCFKLLNLSQRNPHGLSWFQLSFLRKHRLINYWLFYSYVLCWILNDLLVKFWNFWLCFWLFWASGARLKLLQLSIFKETCIKVLIILVVCSFRISKGTFRWLLECFFLELLGLRVGFALSLLNSEAW